MWSGDYQSRIHSLAVFVPVSRLTRQCICLPTSHADFTQVSRTKTIGPIPEVNLDEPAWLIMEWMLRDISSASLPPSDIQLMFRDICAGLTYMHNQVYTHRDIKQENILIVLSLTEGRSIAKICDFGPPKRSIQRMQAPAGTQSTLD